MAFKIIAFPPSTVDQLGQDNFLGPVVDGVHGAQNPNFKEIQTFM